MRLLGSFRTFHPMALGQGVVQTVYRWRGRILLALLIAGIGTATVAGAAGTGIITSCVNKTTGALRIVSSTGSCFSSEVKLSWNQQGPPGPAGPPAPTPLAISCEQCPITIASSLIGNYFAHADLAATSFQEDNLTAADLSGANLSNASFSFTTLKHANLSNANLTGAVLSSVGSATQLQGALLTDAALTNANASGVDFDTATLMTTTITGTDFSAASFRQATLLGATGMPASIQGALWANTTCPDDTNSDEDGGTCAGHFLP